MKTNAFILLILGISLLTGCQTSTRTLGEMKSGYTYIPIDPFAVEIVPCPIYTTTALAAAAATNAPTAITATNALTAVAAKNAPTAVAAKNAPSVGATSTDSYLQFLPDNTVRMAVETIDANGSVSYGPAAISVKGSSYKVTIDYANTDTTSVRLFMCKNVVIKEPKTFFGQIWYFFFRSSLAKGEPTWVSMTSPRQDGEVHGSERYFVRRGQGTNDVDWSAVKDAGVTNITDIRAKGDYFSIPIYIGIGLRVTANIASVQPNVNISGVGNIGGTEMSGSLVVQTLGINGKTISPALPVQTELNQSTVQNSIVSIASIKTHLYDQDTVIVPRVVGLYLPFSGGKQLVSSIISELSREPVKWTPEAVSPNPVNVHPVTIVPQTKVKPPLFADFIGVPPL